LLLPAWLTTTAAENLQRRQVILLIILVIKQAVMEEALGNSNGTKEASAQGLYFTINTTHTLFSSLS
jgi:hypothetical protein